MLARGEDHASPIKQRHENVEEKRRDAIAVIVRATVALAEAGASNPIRHRASVLQLTNIIENLNTTIMDADDATLSILLEEALTLLPDVETRR